MRGQPVVKRQRIALVFKQNARTESGNGRQPALQLLVHRRGMGWRLASLSVEIRISAPVASDGRNCSGAKIRSMSFSERPLTSASAPEVRISRPFERCGQTRRHPHLARRRREVEQRPVNIEQIAHLVQPSRKFAGRQNRVSATFYRRWIVCCNGTSANLDLASLYLPNPDRPNPLIAQVLVLSLLLHKGKRAVRPISSDRRSAAIQ